MDTNTNSEQKKSPIAEREERILDFWNKNTIFKKTLEKKSPKGDFVFYDGPPFATGLPHYGHVLPGTMKDVIPRYKTMQGYHVDRKWGWDCHGLPVENLIEKELGLKTKKDIEALGIETFNTAARNSVFRYRDAWKRIIPRLGRFVDMENDYRTLDPSYTESVWWSWKTLHDKKLAYESFKVMPFCPRCGTTLSNFEVNQGYKDITDISVYAKFKITNTPDTFLLAWTTTPWTLPGNIALAVSAETIYVKAQKDGVLYIVAKPLVQKVLKENYTIIEEFSGKKLVGTSYEPVFSYYADKKKPGVWQVYSADFVTIEDGTGIVHIAPAFGDDDFKLADREGLPMIQHVGEDGAFKPEVIDFAGMLVKPKEDPQKADIEIIKNLAHRGLLFAKEKIIHPYPHCWRCDTPLLNFAKSSWFVKVTALKDKMVALNKKVNWTPEEIGEGRFGKWLEGARDWAVSRTRYWGAPMPIWKSEDGTEMEVLGSLADLTKKTSRGNTFFFIRHGEGEHNAKNILSSRVDNPHHLTEKGRAEIEQALKVLKKKKISALYSSDFVRTRETADILAEGLSIPKENIVHDHRLGEINFGELEGKDASVYHNMFPDRLTLFENNVPRGESLNDIRVRVGAFLYEIDAKSEGKNILVVSHETPIWMMIGVAGGLDKKGIVDLRTNGDFMKTAEIRETSFAAIPHNNLYELDFHRPYIDEITFHSKSGKLMKRIPDIFDTWYDSGSMPFASKKTTKLIPADFIAEGLDQTRGWFYTLLVLGTALFGKSPYKNVVVNGLVLAEDEKKMSKSLNNYPEIEPTIDKYGADALRYFLLASPAVKAEDVKFSEKGLDEVVKKHLQRLDNVYSFYDLYKNDVQDSSRRSENVLDIWIIARLEDICRTVTAHLEKYEFDKASRPIADFVDDLSTWYVRRSRDRFKSADVVDRTQALATTRYVLNQFSKILAPFVPFIAEDIYLKTRTENDPESVNLALWPQVSKKPSKKDVVSLKNMADVRKVISLALEARTKAGIKVRQPLSKLSIKETFSKELVELVKDEVNVKEVYTDTKLSTEVLLDTEITMDLKLEGDMRELLRALQDERKKTGLVPKDRAKAHIPDTELNRSIVKQFRNELVTVASLDDIVFESRETPSVIKV